MFPIFQGLYAGARVSGKYIDAMACMLPMKLCSLLGNASIILTHLISPKIIFVVFNKEKIKCFIGSFEKYLRTDLHVHVHVIKNNA